MKIADVCVQRPIFAVMLIAFLVTLGIFSYRSLGVDLFPRVDPATVNVRITLPGASPEEMTSTIVLPLEDAISSVSGVDEMNARISEGSASITSTFQLDRDIESAAQDIREKVAGAMNRLPPNVLPPVIRKVDPDSDPILSVVVSGARSRRELTEIADKLVRRGIQTVDGVGQVDLVGEQVRQIRILIDAQRLTAHNLTVAQVRDAIVAENVEQPGGHVIQGAEDVGLRTMGRVTDAEQFANIIIAYRGTAPIRVRDVAQVEDGAEDLRVWASLDGNDVVTVQVRRQMGTNTVEIAGQVKARVQALQRQMPAGVKLQVIGDVSEFIKASVNSLLEHLILGGVLASIVVLIFIRNWRAVIIASVAIPTSVISTFTLMKYMNFTLNNMTLLALTLAVGIVIDDAIIVLENIFRHMEEKGEGPIEAAINGTREIGLAVMATTLSLVIIFLPIAFMTGYARRYVNSFGWTMALAIMVSMLVSFTLTPMLSSRLLKVKPQERGESHHGGSRDAKFLIWLDRTYTRALDWSLDHRAAIALICVAAFLTTFPLYRMVGRDWIPYEDQNELDVQLDFPEGQSLDRSMVIMTDMTDKAKQIAGVAYVEPFTQGQTNHGHLYVRLVPRSQRTRSSELVGVELRKLMQGYRNLTFTVRLPTVLGGENYSPIRAIIRGPDIDKLAVFSQRAAVEMRKFPGMVDINPDLRLNKPELQVKVDRQRASDLGVRMADVGSAVRLMYSGQDEISTFKEGEEQYPVVMQLLPEQRDDPDVLARLMVPSAKQGQVRLESIATIERGTGPQLLSRYNREFQATVTAGVARGYALDAAAEATRRAMVSLRLPPGYSFRFSGPVRILNETTTNMILAVALASIFMYMVLAAQFESFGYPFVIMLTLPLSIPFALFSLWITGRSLNLWSALGVFLLLGIVKKNGILQVDYTNRLRSEGVPLRQALVEANRVRLRPILMTTMSIVAGLIPVAIGLGAGSEQRAAIAVTIIGGQSLCLILTLLVVPVAYSYLAQMEGLPWSEYAGLFWGRVRTQVARRFGLF